MKELSKVSKGHRGHTQNDSKEENWTQKTGDKLLQNKLFKCSDSTLLYIYIYIKQQQRLFSHIVFFFGGGQDSFY